MDQEDWLIIDPIFPYREACSADSANTIFGRRFGIPFKTSDKKWFIRILTNNEMFRIYSIPSSNDNYAICSQDDILDELQPFRIPCTFWYDILEDDNRINNMLDYLTLGDSTQCDITQCYFTSKFPEILDWSKLYMQDNNT